MYILWLILAGVFLAVEFGTVALISLWFVIGALAAMAADLLGAVLWLQVLIFSLVSLLMLLLLRPVLRRFVDPHKVPTNVDAIAGKVGLVTEEIDNLRGTGAVKLEGLTWSARSAVGANIPADTMVIVICVEGVKLVVDPMPEGSLPY